jgi:hypothetical protein
MISVVKTRKSKRSTKIELGEELTRFTTKNDTGYEVLTGAVIPYHEFDNKYKTQKEQMDAYENDLKTAQEAVASVYPESSQIFVFSACGKDPTEPETKRWKNSFHFRIRKAGYFKCGKDIPLVPGCDKSVYRHKGKRQLMRMIGCSKEKNKRPLLRLEGKVYQTDEIKELDESLDDYIIQNINGETLNPNPRIEDPEGAEKKLISQVDALNEKENKKLSKMSLKEELVEVVDYETVKSMVGCLSPTRADSQVLWLQVLRCLKNVAELHFTAQIKQVKKLAFSFSELSDKYKKSEVEDYWSREDTEWKGRKIGYRSLCYWAKCDNLNKYYEILKNNKFEYKTQIDKTIDRNTNTKRKYQYSDYRKFIGKNMKQADEVELWKYMSDSIVHVIECGNDKIFTINKYPDGSLKFALLNRQPFFGINNFKFTIDNIPKDMDEYFRKFYHMKSYGFLDFIPYMNINPCPKDVFNLFQGFPITYEQATAYPLDLNKISKILWHLEHIICAGSQSMFRYILNWHAHLFQKPAEKVGVALLLYSYKHGAGKNKWCDFIMDLLGDELWYKATKLEDLTAKFNYHLQSKLLVIGDEIANYAGYKAADQLKARITETNMAIEPKGKDPYCIRSSERYIFTTNSDVPLRIDAQDRRYVTLAVSEEKAQDTEYFAELSKEMEDPEAKRIFLHYLYTLPIDDWKFRDIEMNEYKEQLVNESVENPYEFLVEWLDENPGKESARVKTFYEEYEEYCTAGRYKHVNKKRFKKCMARVQVLKAKDANTGRWSYKINHEVVLKHLKSIAGLKIEVT